MCRLKVCILQQNRVAVFLEFLEKDKFTSVTVDADQSEHLVKLLDAVVIKLEGGSEFDLEVLDQVNAAISQYEAREPRPKPEQPKTDPAISLTPPRETTAEEKWVRQNIVVLLDINNVVI